MVIYRFNAFMFLVLLWYCPLTLAANINVYYPQPTGGSYDQGNYYVKMLALALDKAKVTYKLSPRAPKMLQQRALLQLAQGGEINVMWTMTSRDREKNLLPIRIPLDKGLLGWRVFLVNKNLSPDFSQVKTLADLKPYTAVQGSDWPDTEIFKLNGLKIEGVPGFNGIFEMMHQGRFDYFPRSIFEVFLELEGFKNLNLEIEKTLLLQYPAAMYFFVHKTDKKLASAIEKGLNASIDDGSFDALFNNHFAHVIQRINLKGRTRLQLTNPLLPEQTPLQKKKLWFSI